MKNFIKGDKINYIYNNLKGSLRICLYILGFIIMHKVHSVNFIMEVANINAPSIPVIGDKDFITWVDFKVSTPALKAAYHYDLNSQEEDVKIDWIELLAFLGAKYGGDFKNFKASDMDGLVNQLKDGETIEELTEQMKYYSYYYESYSAILSGLVGEYEIEIPTTDLESASGTVWEKRYGLKGFFPIAKNYPYSHYDDFGVSRSYGYKRRHLGHDMMGQVGTPIIAIESGYVEVLGWNKYGGWRIGIKSFDEKRYYYYAHLRQNYPYYDGLKEGSIVQAGDVIGYLGRTGYSTNENVNNINVAHLHLGIQLIFDESQKEGPSEIWIDCYSLVNFLYQNRIETMKKEATKDHHRIHGIKDFAVEEYIKKNKPHVDEGNISIHIYSGGK